MGVSKWLKRVPLLFTPRFVTLPKYSPPIKKICVITSLGEDASPASKKYSDIPDPSRYIPKSRHEFVVRHVALANAKSEIDAICEEGFDLYINYICGDKTDTVGLEATRYLESKGVPLLNNPSSFLEKNTLDSLRAAKSSGFVVPADTPGKYPKIVKHEDGCGSFDLGVDSICYSEEEVNRRVASLKEEDTRLKIVVYDHIVGKKCSVIVIEMGREAVALNPLEYTSPREAANEQEGKNDFTYAFIEDEHRATLQVAAEKAFKAVEGSGFARVDMCLEQGTGDVYVLEVVGTPLIFFPAGNTFGDDFVISEKFPGGHAAFFDLLLATKRIQLSSAREQDSTTAGFFDKLAPQYDKVLENISFGKIHSYHAQHYDFSGTVLDVACGTGTFGKALDDQGVVAELSGIELSPGMAASPYAKKHYKQPIRVGPMQELIMGEGEYDHVVCLGSLHLVDAIDVTALLTRMFMLARKSVSFDIDDLDEDYSGFFQKWQSETVVYPYIISVIKEFGVPNGWKQVDEKKHFLSKHPVNGSDVHHVSFRFEKL